MPALLNSTSSRPNVSLTVANRPRTASGSPTSVGTARARAPAAPAIPRSPAEAPARRPASADLVALAQQRQRGRPPMPDPGARDDRYLAHDPPPGCDLPDCQARKLRPPRCCEVFEILCRRRQRKSTSAVAAASRGGAAIRDHALDVPVTPVHHLDAQPRGLNQITRSGPSRECAKGEAMSVEIAVIGAQRPFVLEALEREFTVHKVFDAPDKVAALAARGRARPRRGDQRHGRPADQGLIEALPKLEICAIIGVGLETTDLALAKGARHRRDHHAGALRRRRRPRRGSGAVRLPPDRRGRPLRALRAAGCRAGCSRRASSRASAPASSASAASAWRSRRACRLRHAHRLLSTRCRSAGCPTRPTMPVALAQDSDILFLCAAGGPGRRPHRHRRVLDALGPEGIFVNVARGWLVDEAALVAGAERGPARRRRPGRVRARAAGAGRRCSALDNVVLTPHIASNTEETMRAMGECVLDNVRSWFAGKGAVNSGGVNPRLCRAKPRAARDRDSESPAQAAAPRRPGVVLDEPRAPSHLWRRGRNLRWTRRPTSTPGTS